MEGQIIFCISKCWLSLSPERYYLITSKSDNAVCYLLTNILHFVINNVGFFGNFIHEKSNEKNVKNFSLPFPFTIIFSCMLHYAQFLEEKLK